MERVKIISLSEDKAECCREKNAYIEDCRDGYLAFLYQDKLSEARFAEYCEREDPLAYGEVVVFCAGEEQDALQLSLEDALQCFYLQIAGLVFRREVLEQTGSYNERLHALSDYELLCRLTESVGSCLLVFPGIPEDALSVGEEELLTYAYLIRRYSVQLQGKGSLEGVLSQMYRIAESAGQLPVLQGFLNQMLTESDMYEQLEAATAPFLIFRGDDTCYGVMRDFADTLGEELRRLGQAVIMAEPDKIDYDYLQTHVCKGIIGFQAVALGNDFFKSLHGPKLQFWVDNPVFYKKWFERLGRDCYILCHDSNYLEYIREYYHLENLIQMPPAGHAPTDSPDEGIFWERPYDIVFVGSYLLDLEELSGGFQRDYYEYMLKHPWLDYGQGLRTLLSERDITMEAQEFMDCLESLKPVCQKIFRYYRKKVIDTILEAGYEIHVYGDSWDMYDSPYAHRLVRHSEVTVEESLAEWRKAKIGLNVMSWHKGGMTERVANIMLSGALCLSEETQYLKEHFVDGEEIVCYRLDRLEELPRMISELLESERSAEIARGGYEAALREHTWEQRARQLLELVNHIWRGESHTV
ncbi:MAG: glycosyltransferase [Butyrivibrio sp.]|nr:glycosyltransferase [Muribaculum sp.]MCM1551362.1 glycosyltransferase [Butyrivibrio sp.]